MSIADCILYGTPMRFIFGRSYGMKQAIHPTQPFFGHSYDRTLLSVYESPLNLFRYNMTAMCM